MVKYFQLFGIAILFVFYCPSLYAQLLSWSPSFPGPNDPIEITLDATKGNKALVGFTGIVYVHIGVITSASQNSTDWRYAPFTWGGTVANSQAVALGINKWKFSITNIRSFFNVPANEDIFRIAILFRQGGCTNCIAQRNIDGSDMYIPVSTSPLQLRFEKPPFQPLYNPFPEPLQLMVGQTMDVKIIAKESAAMSLWLNGVLVVQKNDTTSLSTTLNLTTAGGNVLKGIAINAKGTAGDSLFFSVSGTVGPVVTKPIPPGTRPGINRMPGDTSLILALVAPNKSKVSVIGDFPGNEWTDKPEYQMNLDTDNKTWWIKINGLQPNVEYSYQYLVDGSLKVADPYAEKILDPFNDNFISANTYPQLKPYPSGKTSGIVGIVQTNSSGYVWKNNFKRPDKTQLVIYELLVRDFLFNHDFNALIDTLTYLSSLGINAIELMPVGEFEGNQSWGYNPDFYFAVDKYYGTENSLRRLIDSCHGRGIAVILDMVLNHATALCPLAALYWDAVNLRPAPDNPWFNVTAKHPFNVFNDFNHESPDTKYFSTRVMEYWLKEYKVDGYRFDLSKGFTQKNNPNDVNAWGAYDASRIAIWKQYYDSIQTYSSGAYTILEHFADNAEEVVLSDAGMLLWGNANYNYNEATMGYVNTSNFDWSLSQVRGWTNRHLVSYMESHDEERLMYRNQQFGNLSGAYSTKNINTALDRMKLAASFFFMSPGPKMIWQFGEVGYDFAINTCVNGTVNNNCRLDNKPITWQYTKDPARKALLDWYTRLLTLRKSTAWQAAAKTVNYSLSGGVKWLGFSLNNNLNLIVVGNFDLSTKNVPISFPKTGTWIDLKDNSILNVTQTNTDLTLSAGEYHVYMDKPFDQITPTYDLHATNELLVRVFPNPSNYASTLELILPETTDATIQLITIQGQVLQTIHEQRLAAGIHNLNLRADLTPGTYFIQVLTRSGSKNLKYIRW